VGIRESRQRKLLSQHELTERAGVSETTIVKLDLGAATNAPHDRRSPWPQHRGDGRPGGRRGNSSGLTEARPQKWLPASGGRHISDGGKEG
jgi:hypothetical protein